MTKQFYCTSVRDLLTKILLSASLIVNGNSRISGEGHLPCRESQYLLSSLQWIPK